MVRLLNIAAWRTAIFEVYVRTLYTGPGRLGEWRHPDDFILLNTFNKKECDLVMTNNNDPRYQPGPSGRYYTDFLNNKFTTVEEGMNILKEGVKTRDSCGGGMYYNIMYEDCLSVGRKILDLGGDYDEIDRIING